MRKLLKSILKEFEPITIEQWRLFSKIETELAKPDEPIARICNSLGGGKEIDWFGKDITKLPVGTKLYAHPPKAQGTDNA